MRWSRFVFVIACGSLVAACKKDDKPAPITEQAPPSASSSPLEVGSSSYVIKAAGKASVYIDAPLEKFKGATPRLGGYFHLDPKKLDQSSGTITASLLEFTTSTFDDKDKNETQTEHAHNWFEIGDDVKAKRPKDFENYKDVVFRIETIESVTPSSDLSQVKEENGARTVTFKAKGTLWVHSRPAPKTVTVDVSFKGPADAPTEVSFKSKEPMHVSLAAHDVKPRDTAGKFLDGALRVVGKKMDDDAQISIEGTATRETDPKAASMASASASAVIGRHEGAPAADAK
ncbi:MAG: hypothetical protein HYV09_26805 [Deltaproteobacteria bacterium]|nr:hypothetical protein [Deltaproteobacteria bacterium]